MKNLFEAGKLLLLDMAATLFFLALYLLTHNVPLSVVLGMVLGLAQIGWQFARSKPVDTMQWLSLVLPFFIAEGIVRGWSEPGRVRALAAAELLLAMVAFAALLLAVRRRRLAAHGSTS